MASRVMAAPFFDGPPGIINKPDGSVMFEALATGNPQPEFKWIFKGQEIQSDDRRKVGVKKIVGKFNITLVIKNPGPADQGVYKLVATNQGGTREIEQGYSAVCTADSVYKLNEKYT